MCGVENHPLQGDCPGCGDVWREPILRWARWQSREYMALSGLEYQRRVRRARARLLEDRARARMRAAAETPAAVRSRYGSQLVLPGLARAV